MTDPNYGAKDFLLARYKARRASIPCLSDFIVTVIISVPVPRARVQKQQEERDGLE